MNTLVELLQATDKGPLTPEQIIEAGVPDEHLPMFLAILRLTDKLMSDSGVFHFTKEELLQDTYDNVISNQRNSYAYLLNQFNKDNFLIDVMWSGNNKTLVGYLAFTHPTKTEDGVIQSEILDLWVAPEFREKHIACTLLDGWARAMKKENVDIAVVRSYIDVVEFWEKWGFVAFNVDEKVGVFMAFNTTTLPHADVRFYFLPEKYVTPFKSKYTTSTDNVITLN